MRLNETIRKYHGQVLCRSEDFAIVVPILYRIQEDAKALIASALNQIRSLHAGVFKDVTLDEFLEILNSNKFVAVGLVTHYEHSTGQIEFRDGLWKPDEFVNRLAKIQEGKILDLTCCRSTTLMEEIKKTARQIVPVKATDTELDVVAAVFYFETVVRLLSKVGRFPYPQVAMMAWEACPKVEH